jgi:hypothetical protein
MRTFVKKMAALLIAAMPCLMFAQTIRYDYDGAGNRLTRVIVMSPNRIAKSASIDEFLSDSLSERNIRIYPNPTQGLLRIRIDQLSEEDICSIRLFSLSGQQILVMPLQTTETELNISDQSNGIYILQILLNGEASSWKIIKE